MRQPFDLDKILQEQKRQRNKKRLSVIGFLTLVGITILLFKLPALLGFEDYNYCSDKLAEFCSMLEIVLPLFPTLAAFAALGSLIWGAYLIKQLFGLKDARQELLERAETNAILQERVEGMPEWESPIPLEDLESKKSRRKKWLFFFFVHLPIALAIHYGIQYLWPNVRGLLMALIDSVLGIILFFLFPDREQQAKFKLEHRHFKKWAKEKQEVVDDGQKTKVDKMLNRMEQADPYSWRYRLQIVFTILISSVLTIGLCFLIVLYPKYFVGWLPKILRNFAQAGLILFGLYLLTLLGYAVSQRWPIFKTNRALKRGDYELALHLLEQIEQWEAKKNVSLAALKEGYRRFFPLLMGNNSKDFRLFLRGTILQFAGEYSKAEEMLRECLIARQDMGTTKQQSVAMEALGAALIGQERYDEAIQVLEGAILVWPEGHESYSTLAEAYLFQGIEAQKVLLLAQTARHHKRQRLSWGLILDRYQFGEAWADQAWALALQGEHKEADKALKWAFRLADKGFKPTFAGIHYRAGRTKQLMGDWPTAVQHYRNAQELDPRGHYGRLARLAVKR